MKRLYSPSIKNLYERLGVSKHSSTKEIKSAYYEKSRLFHPDVGGTPADFHSIKEAYEILSNPDKRTIYNKSMTRIDLSGMHSQVNAEEEIDAYEYSPQLIISLGILAFGGCFIAISTYYHTFIEKSPKLMQEDLNYYKSRAFVLETTPQDFYHIHYGPGWKFEKKKT